LILQLSSHNGIWFLFTTSVKGLEIYYLKDIEKGKLISHPCNPITIDTKYCRCGGGPVFINKILFRIAQDCSSEYGENISILKIKKLSETEYEEELMIGNYFDKKETWNSRGGHHLSCVEFNGSTIIAVDGKQNDYIINNFLSISYLIYKKIRKIICNL